MWYFQNNTCNVALCVLYLNLDLDVNIKYKY